MGWRFASAARQEDIGYPWQMDNVTQDKLYGSTYLKELYLRAQKGEILIFTAGCAGRQADRLVRSNPDYQERVSGASRQAP
jgi:hypothetical protein